MTNLNKITNIILLIVDMSSVVLFHGDPGCYLVEKRELSAAVRSQFIGFLKYL